MVFCKLLLWKQSLTYIIFCLANFNEWWQPIQLQDMQLENMISYDGVLMCCVKDKLRCCLCVKAIFLRLLMLNQK